MRIPNDNHRPPITRGFSILEALISLTVFGVLAAGTLVLVWGPVSASADARERSRANLLAEEGLEAARSVRNDNWTYLTDGDHGLVKTIQWSFSGTSDTADIFTRVINIAPVNRDDITGDIVTSGGTPDPRTKKITSTVTWNSSLGSPRSVSATAYLSDWNVYDWTQDTDADFAAGTASQTAVSGSGPAATVTLAPQDDWQVGGGTTVVHTTDADFNAGTFSGTAVDGSGALANVRLAAAVGWTDSADPGGSVTQTTNTDLSAGAAAGLSVSGTGSAASVQLSAPSWTAAAVGTAVYNDIDLYSATEGFAVGAGGVIVRWNGTAWSSVNSPTNRALYGVNLSAANDGWAVGDRASVMARWNGTAWVDATDISGWGNNAMNSVDCWSTSVCGVVGAGGRWSFWNGTVWTAAAQYTGTPNLLDIKFTSATQAIAIAATGAIIRATFSGGVWTWAAMTSGMTTQLNGLDCTSASNCLAVGNVTAGAAVIRYWDGTSWAASTSGTANALNEVKMIDPTTAVAVGAAGTVRRGTYAAGAWTWTADVSNTANALNGVDFISASGGYAVGAAGTTDRYSYYGTFISSSLDSGVAGTVWNVADWTAAVPPGTTLTVATRAAATTPPTGGTWTNVALIDSETGSASIAAGGGTGQYLQYRLTVAAVFGSNGSAVIDDVTLTYGAAGTVRFNAMDMVSATDGWAVGAAGTIYRWNGTSWSAFTPSPTANSLFGIKMVSATDGWAVGAGGVIIRWNGTSWATVTSPVSSQLNAVDLVSATDGWAVGAGGVIIRWNGTSWATVTSPTSNDLHGISLSASGDGWAVGRSNTFTRLSGSTWSAGSGPFTSADDLFAVRMIAAADGQAVGKNGIIARWDGSSWAAASSPTTHNLYAIEFVSASDGWAVGAAGTVIRWTGSWAAAVSGTTKTLRAVSAVAAADVWAAGASATFIHYFASYSTSGTNTFISSVIDAGSSVTWNLLTWTQSAPPGTTVSLATRTGDTSPPAGAWSAELTDPLGSAIASAAGRYLQYRITLATTDASVTPQVDDVTVLYGRVTGSNLLAVSAAAANDVQAVGAGGVIIRWNGTAWSSVTSPTTNQLNGVHLYSSTLGFAVGAGGTIIRWNGTAWSSVTSPTTRPYYAVEISAANDAWAVTDRDSSMSRWDGTAWSIYAGVPAGWGNRFMYAVDCWSASVCGVVGEGGRYSFWNGTVWTAAATVGGTNPNLRAIRLTSAGTAFAVGDGGTIFYWNGTAWTSQTSPTAQNLYALWMNSPTAGWAVGAAGVIIRWDGTVWSSVTSPTTGQLNGLVMTSVIPGDGWAVGNGGVVVRYTFGYATSGTLLSSVLDTDAGSAVWDAVFFGFSAPPGTTLTAAARSGDTATPDGSWSAWSPEMSSGAGTAISVPAARYLQYRLTLSTADSGYTPALDNITLTYRK